MKPARYHNNTSRDVILLSIFTLACLAPFLNKAFHIDDTLFLWTARQIQSRPFDFYGFIVNWYSYAEPMYNVAKNPPVSSYYLAVVTHFFGWSELAVHTAYLVPALAAATGTYFVASELSCRPLVASAAAVFTPGFLLSATTVMCDTMMVALWLWAVYFWIRGIKNGSLPAVIFASLLVALCSLTKYYGMSLIPLLFIYGLQRKRKLGVWAMTLLLPVFVLIGYQLFTLRIYGIGLLRDASAYSIERHRMQLSYFLDKSLSGVVFTGGCFISALFYVPVLWKKRAMALMILLSGVSLCTVFLVRTRFGSTMAGINGLKFPFIVQSYILAIAGLAVLALAVFDLLKNRDADSVLLFLWTMGTFVFASFINWSVNGRSVLPMSAAAGILIARRIPTMNFLELPHLRRLIFLPALCSLIVSLAVLRADFSLANSSRSAANEIYGIFNDYGKGKLWFQGHWGFQYYMEKVGGRPLDIDAPAVKSGDVMAVPEHNTNVKPLPLDQYSCMEVVRIKPFPFVSTIARSLGAGFYSDVWGPLPFAFGPVPDENYYVFIIK